jgi:hypothetical protein
MGAPLLLLLFLRCGPGATPEDLERLERIKGRYGDEYDISLRQSTYVEAEYKDRGCPEREEARAIHRAFWMSGDRSRGNSNYIYLNLFDRNGKFCYQLYWNPDSQGIDESSQPYY